MSVVEFRQAIPTRCRTWQGEERQQLLALCSAHTKGGELRGWEIGATEADDPQFYLLGPSPEEDCKLCITRVGRVYVLHDEFGSLLAEDARLKPVIKQASAMLSKPDTSVAMRMLFWLCAFRVT